MKVSKRVLISSAFITTVFVPVATFAYINSTAEESPAVETRLVTPSETVADETPEPVEQVIEQAVEQRPVEQTPAVVENTIIGCSTAELAGMNAEFVTFLEGKIVTLHNKGQELGIGILQNILLHKKGVANKVNVWVGMNGRDLQPRPCQEIKDDFYAHWKDGNLGSPFIESYLRFLDY